MKALWLVVGGYTMSWGLWLLSPFWTVFRPQAGLYSEMANFMPEWAWGAHATIVGACIIYGILYHWPRGLWWGRLATIYHWGLIGVLYAFGDWHNTGALTALMIIVLTQVLWKKTPQTPEVHPLD